MLGNIISAIGSVAGGFMAANNAKKQMAMQREFAQNQLQWKAADAEKAGISKIFAMGAPTTSYAPVSVGDYGLADAGKSIGAGINNIAGQGGASSTTTAKVSGITAAIQQAQLDGLKIDNDIKRTELASKIAIATQPGAGGTLDRDVIQTPEGLKLKKEQAPAGYLPQKSFGVSPEVDLYRTHSGYAPQIPQQLQEAFENDALGRWQWNIRNRIQPMWDMDLYGSPPRHAPPGKYWMYNPIIGQYVEYPIRGDGRPPIKSVKELYDRLRR